jgi:hypothetical protein
MTAESTTTTVSRPGGFDGDPFAALNPPAASAGCCRSEQTAQADRCGATPASDGCCDDVAAPAGSAGCCS